MIAGVSPGSTKPTKRASSAKTTVKRTSNAPVGPGFRLAGPLEHLREFRPGVVDRQLTALR